MRYLYGEPRSRAEAQHIVAQRARQQTLEQVGDCLVRAMERRDSGVMIGFVLHPDHQGQGYGREAASEMLRLGFEGLALHRIFGRCDSRNDASAQLMERLGMRREAHFHENERFKGEWSDEHVEQRRRLSSTWFNAFSSWSKCVLNLAQFTKITSGWAGRIRTVNPLLRVLSQPQVSVLHDTRRHGPNAPRYAMELRCSFRNTGPATLAGLHFAAFICLLLPKLLRLIGGS
jgi:GNAT superfamily N-acetyltransferase